jgi:hypothetical protein
MTGSWDFRVEGTTTVVDLANNIDVAGSVLARTALRFAERHAQHDLDRSLDDLKRRLEADAS